jgi:glycosyltransferase involved in cell wall biosynthesis
MPVHNGLPFLDESVRSILAQTFEDFELVILDDASTDGTAAALRAWAEKDARIRLYSSRQRLGPSGSSNFVVAQSRAPLVARMDADDVSHPERLKRQWSVMQRRPDLALLGTLCDGIDAQGRRVRPRDRWRILRRSTFPPFPHGSVMFRRRAFEEAGGYREECAGREDHDLFLRMAGRWRVAVLPEALYSYRYHLNSSSLSAPATPGGGDATGLSALRSPAAMQLWAGHRPAVLRPALRRATAERSVSAIVTLGWAAWARLSPGSLRSFTRLLVRARDGWAGRRLADGGVYEWRLK